MPSKKQRQKRKKQALEAAADANFGGASDESLGDGPTNFRHRRKRRQKPPTRTKTTPTASS